MMMKKMSFDVEGDPNLCKYLEECRRFGQEILNREKPTYADCVRIPGFSIKSKHRESLLTSYSTKKAIASGVGHVLFRDAIELDGNSILFHMRNPAKLFSLPVPENIASEIETVTSVRFNLSDPFVARVSFVEKSKVRLPATKLYVIKQLLRDCNVEFCKFSYDEASARYVSRLVDQIDSELSSYPNYLTTGIGSALERVKLKLKHKPRKKIEFSAGDRVSSIAHPGFKDEKKFGPSGDFYI